VTSDSLKKTQNTLHIVVLIITTIVPFLLSGIMDTNYLKIQDSELNTTYKPDVR